MEKNMLHLLIVDDEKITRNVIRKHITWEDYGIEEIMEATDGLEALQISREFHPDLVLCDVRMPRMNGLEFAQEYLKEDPGCHVIFLSGYSDREYLKTAIRLRAVNYIEKPINLDEIRRTVSDACTEMLEIRRKNTLAQNINRKKECFTYLNGTPLSDQVTPTPGFTHPNDLYLSVYLRLFTDSEAMDIGYEDTEILDSLKNVLKRFFPDHFPEHFLYAMKDLTHLILHVHLADGITIDKIQNALVQFQYELETTLPDVKKILGGIGNPVRGTMMLAESGRHARAARYTCFTTGQIEVYKTAAADCPQQKQFSFDSDFPAAVLNDFSDQDKHKLCNDLDELCSLFRTTYNASEENVKIYFLRLLLVLTQRAQNINKLYFEELSLSYVNAIANACCLQEIQEYMNRVIADFFRTQDSQQQTVWITDTVTQYILQNYSDVDLCISKIASVVYVSPSYLSLIFKQHTGKTINQYITEVRIHTSKKLLRNGELQLKTIAQQVGYRDSNYFSKAFKREVGVNPKTYRDIETSKRLCPK